MSHTFGTALRFSLLTWVIFGLAYPLAEVGINQLVFPGPANGSLVRQGGRIVGSRLIEQRFRGPQWFHGRPSAVDMDPRSSGASNLGPSSRRLARHLAARRNHLLARHPALVGQRLPADMITSSGSGLDPDITPANAYLQARWVARARGLPQTLVRRLVARNERRPWLGLFGQARVNVLSLNLGLQALMARRGYGRMGR